MQSNNKPVCNFCGEEIIKPKRAYRSSHNGCIICEECDKILYGKKYKNIEKNQGKALNCIEKLCKIN